jgi:hypothetical protein
MIPKARTRFAAGLLLGALPVLVIWMLEPVPGPYRAVAMVQSSAASYLVPCLVAVIVGIRWRGAGLAGVLIGSLAGFGLALAIAGPHYVPHPWDELDGAPRAWFIAAGCRTLAATWVAGIVAWAAAALVRQLGRPRQGSRGSEPGPA